MYRSWGDLVLETVVPVGVGGGPWLAGIHGTRHPRLEQQDVLLYAARVEYRLPGARLHLGALGHVHWLNDWTHRGNENLGEVRAGLRWGTTRWLDLEVVAGYTEMSPAWGVRARFGTLLASDL